MFITVLVKSFSRSVETFVFYVNILVTVINTFVFFFFFLVAAATLCRCSDGFLAYCGVFIISRAFSVLSFFLELFNFVMIVCFICLFFNLLQNI